MRNERACNPIIAALFMMAAFFSTAAGASEIYYFGVINQRSVPRTAEAWNPILKYVSEKTGVNLVLRMGKTAPETTEMTVRGEHAFVYTNHMFSPDRDRLGYRVILRMAEDPIQGAIIVRDNSVIQTVTALHGKKVVFPSRDAFVGYWLPKDHLVRSGVVVEDAFGGNQEGAMAQLQVGDVDAAAVNRSLLTKYAERESFRYQMIWTSEPYLGIPIMANPKVPKKVVDAVQDAFASMHLEEKGRDALHKTAVSLGLAESWRFLKATDKEYENYRRFYRNTVLK